jgi:4-hydroxy-tetrahydrodipicolinate synthase
MTDYRGIYPSTICPLRADFALDESALAEHTRSLARVDGIRGILCNGHAGENFVTTRDEQRRVVAVTRASIRADQVLIAGVNCESTAAALALARDARQEGADALLVFPPFSWAVGQDEEVALRHHEAIGAAVDLPLMLFQGAVRSGTTAYTPVVLDRLARMPKVVAVKEGSWETSAYEENRRIVKRAAPHVAVMASGDEHLFSCFVLGSDGSQVSLADIIPEAIVELDRAVRRSDLAAARDAHETIFPLARAIYGAPPGGHATARLKAVLVLLGRLASDAVKPPLSPICGTERELLEAALREARVLR